MRLNNFVLQGTELAVNGRLTIETESLGGNTSGSDRANNGIKPKMLIVSLVIKFDQVDHLRELIRTAEATDANGKLVVYDIVDPTAQGMNIRQVQFDETLNVRDLIEKKAWRVTFTLSEYLSIPEKTEQRQQTETPEEQSAEGEQVASANTEEQGGTEELTGFEKVLKFADDALAPDEPEAQANAVA